MSLLKLTSLISERAGRGDDGRPGGRAGVNGAWRHQECLWKDKNKIISLLQKLIQVQVLFQSIGCFFNLLTKPIIQNTFSYLTLSLYFSNIAYFLPVQITASQVCQMFEQTSCMLVVFIKKNKLTGLLS